MKLKVNQLKQFNSVAGSIKQNRILPILSYLKFEDGKITKNNLESFVEMEADFEGSFLINEKILMGFIDKIEQEEIEVKVEEKRTIISCGKKKIVSPTESVINYPKSHKSDGVEVQIPIEVMTAIDIASNFTLVRESMPFTSCVFIGNGIVSASSGYISYSEKIDDSIPKIILEKHIVPVIRKLKTVFFSQNESYIFFTNGLFRYGFSKKDTSFIDMAKLSLIPEGNVVSINKTDLKNFCDTCVNITDNRGVYAQIDCDRVYMEDADYGIKNEIILPCELPPLMFNPDYMLKVLSSIPDDDINIIQGTNRYVITGKSGFVSVIMNLQFK